jgi:adenosylcobinamide-GDP ribazoletransferase
LVGLALGAALVGLDAAARVGLSEIVVGAILVIALLMLTRALHTEGFLDCCDGLFGGYTPKDRLRILRDTHVGAFAVIGGAALIVIKWSLLASLPDESRIGLLLVFPCLSRFGMLVTMAAFPYARAQGLGTSFQRSARWWQLLIGLVTALLVAVLFLGPGGLILFGAVTLVALGAGRWMTGRLGGMTGDTYGAVNELGEVSALMLGIALTPALSGLFEAPFW